MADTKDTDLSPTGTTAAEAETRAVMEAIERILRGGGPRTSAEVQERALAEISAGLSSGPPTAEQVIVELWDAADLGDRLDALLARFAETERAWTGSSPASTLRVADPPAPPPGPAGSGGTASGTIGRFGSTVLKLVSVLERLDRVEAKLSATIEKLEARLRALEDRMLVLERDAQHLVDRATAEARERGAEAAVRHLATLSDRVIRNPGDQIG